MAQTTVLIGVNPCLTEGYLKKQSQFSKSKVGVSIYMKGDYEKFYALKAAKNKANSKPICYRSVFCVQQTASKRRKAI